MKKDEFLKLLHAKLIERGINKETADREISHVNTYLTESGMDELKVSLDEMADGIISMIESGEGKNNGEEGKAVPIVPKTKEKKNEKVADELGEAIAKIDEKPRRSPETYKPRSDEKKPKEKKPKEKNPKQDEKPEVKEGEEKRSLLYRLMAKVDKFIKSQKKDKDEKKSDDKKSIKKEKLPKKVKNKKEKKQEATDDSDILVYVPYEQKEKMQYDSNGRMKNAWLYVAILVVAIPIAVALIIISSVLYVGFWTVLALLMIACIAVLVAFVTVGAFVSIVGIVYGVVELITGNTPVGLFEIGLGVIVGSAVMFVGILVYNFAVRFIPFGMKMLAKLFKLGFRALRSGYNSLKGAVSNL